jgi:protein-S-isoprenylcysteine O-methyltransferase Ste14
MFKRAADFEFRHRVWIIGAIFWLAFSCYGFDHVRSAEGLLLLISGGPLNVHSVLVRYELYLIFAVAALLITARAWMRPWGTAYLRTEVVHDSSLHSERLVADGPYRHVRIPLYFGNLLMAIGIGLMASRTGWFVLVILMTLFVYRLLGREEAGLLKSQGNAYRAYLAAVPRL